MSKQHHTYLPARKPRTVKAMRAFLAGHDRYNTMNSWNNSTSYSVCVKISHLRLTAEELDKCYDLMAAEDCLEASGFNDALSNFDYEHDHEWQIGMNGRSNGYCVLYQGGTKADEHKSRCSSCGQKNFQAATDTDKRCGRCGQDTRYNLPEGRRIPYTMPGRGTDEDGVDEMDSSQIRSRFALVWDFDQAVEWAVAAFVATAMRVTVEEVTVMVPTKVMAIVDKEAEVPV